MNYQKILDEAGRKKVPIIHLCNAIGITSAGFYKMIKNRSMTIETLEKISDELKVNIHFWFNENTNEYLYNENDNSLKIDESKQMYAKHSLSIMDKELKKENDRLQVENQKLNSEVSKLKDKIIVLLETK